MYKRNIKQKLVISSAFIVGIIIAIYIKTLDSSKVYITLEERKKIENNIEITNKELIKLKEYKKELEKELNQYQGTLKDNQKSISELMKDKIKYLEEESGYTDIKGEGIILQIKDSEHDLKEGQNPNDLIVHDIDILRIVNDLKLSGAKAISINGERIISSSKIKCSGATITVNETTYGQPFIIKAIGDTDNIMLYMNSPESYTSLLKEGYGIYINVEQKSDIVVEKYEKYK